MAKEKKAGTIYFCMPCDVHHMDCSHGQPIGIFCKSELVYYDHLSTEAKSYQAGCYFAVVGLSRFSLLHLEGAQLS